MRARPRLLASTAITGGLVLAALALLLSSRHTLDPETIAIPVPSPVYEIEAVSNGHEVHLLNLPLPNVGAAQVPIPVDINGDLLPDVTASVNLVNAQGVFNNPPDTGEVVAPNIEFTRLFTGPILNPIASHDLRINVKLTILDAQGEEPPTIVRFGYDTGQGGSIPPKYKAVLGGLETFFSPLQARIDTTGGLLIGLDPRVPDLGLGPQSPAYQGPLTTFAAFDTGPELRADVDLRFRPMPDLVEVSYDSRDDGTQAFTYAHNETGEVDLDIDGHLEADGVVATLDARIDRLPRQVALDVLTGEDEGGVLYTSQRSSGRLPDLAADIVLDDPEFTSPLRARLDAESLPDTLGGRWRLAPGEPPEIDFSGSGQGIGAIEARVQNYEGEPTDFEPWVPTEQQHVAIQVGPDGVLIGDTLIQARLERLRGATVHATEEGSIEGHVEIGDGERPLQVHGQLDLRPDGAPFIEATATISPLPDTIDFVVTPNNGVTGEPMRVRYEPSETVDVDTQAFVALPGTEGLLECGDPGTACADVSVRNVPTLIEARVHNLPSDTRIEVDAIPREGAAPLDVFADATVGPIDELGAPLDSLFAAPVHAEVDVQGLPRFARFRILENGAQDLQRVDVRTCDLDYDTNECAPGTDDEVAEMDFAVRNWTERPADLPAPPESGPLFVTVTGRGLPDTNELVNYEATGRMTDFRQLTYLGTHDLTAVRADIGSGEDFRTWIDVEDVDLDGGSPDEGRIDLDGDIRVTPLPTPLTFCIAQPGRALTSTPIDDITAACEDPDPFGDDTATTGPLTVAYRAGAPFDVIADVELRGDLPVEQPESEIDFGTFDRVGSHLELTDIPGDFTAYVATPAESSFDLPGDAEATGTRVRTVAPGADETRLDLEVELTTEGVDCADPDPDGVGGVAGALCADLLIDGLPSFASALLTTATTPGAADDAVEQRFEAYGCDRDFFAATPACRPGTEGSIGVIEAGARAHAGQPDGVETFVPPADEPHVVALADVDDLANFEVEAGLRVEDLRAVAFRQHPDGTELHTDVGNGTDPLTVHGRADLRDAATVLDDEQLLDLRADLQLDPLPDLFSFVQTGPGANQTDPMHIEVDSSSDVALFARGEVRHASSDGPDCGASATLCAELTVDAIPAHLDADILRTSGPVVGRERESSTEVHIDLDPHAPGDPKPRIDVHAAAGVPADVPVVGGLPLFADLALVGIPLHTTVDLDNREVLMGSNEVRSSNLERFQFHACDRLDDDTCRAGTEDRIDLIEASARTVERRPTDFPAPPAPGPGVPPAYISLAGRGDALEAYARIPDISEVQFVNQRGVVAATASVGGGTPVAPVDLGINVDVLDLPIRESLDLGDVTYVDPLLDARAALTISPFPGDLSFCLREGGIRPVPAPSGIDFAAACEDTDPFDTGTALGETPLSVAFDSEGTTFSVDLAAELTIDGVDANGDALPTNRLVGDLALGDVPDELRFHFLQPRLRVVPNASGFSVQPRGQYRARLEAPGATSGLDVSFGAQHLVGDGAQCEDPRPTVSATCASASLSNLPTLVDFLYDPDLDLLDPTVDLADLQSARNLYVFADGPEDAITIDSVHFSRVRPRLQADGEPVSPPRSDVIVADLDLGDVALPMDVRGTIFLPEAEGQQPIIDVENLAGDVLPEVGVDIRSYIAPNPFVEYDTRYALSGGLPVRTVANNGEDVHTLALLQRGDAIRLQATLPALRRASVRAVLDEQRNALGTFAVDVGFATGFNVRAFLDLQPDQTTHIYADARLDDIPANMSLCFRGARLAEVIGHQPIPGTGTWCDTAEVRDDEGAFEFAQQPNSGASTMDVDAFVRLMLGGGSTLISGRVDIDEIPQVMRGRLPGQVLQVQGLRPQFGALGGPLVADGIDRIAFQAATFDIDPTEAGYGTYAADPSELPYPFQPLAGGPFPAAPAPADGREYLHVAGDVPNQQFHVRGQLGRTDGAPSSQLQELYYSSLPCDEGPAADPAARDAQRASRAEDRVDYPHLPSTDGTTHTCIAAAFDPTSDGVNPLSLRADVDVDPETTIRLRQGGLDNIPQWFEANIADAPPFQDMVEQRGWRRPCGPQTDGFADCMAPLIRFDQPDDVILFGAVEVGRRTDLDAVLTVDPSGPAPSFDALPTATGWDGAFTGDRGARVRIVDFPDASPVDDQGRPQDPYLETRQAISATVRIPVPHSLTLDTPQKFANDDLLQRTEVDKHVVGGTAADDMRFRVAVRDDTGQVLDPNLPGQNLGDVALYMARQDRKEEMVVGRPCDLNPLVEEVLGALPTAIAEGLQSLFLAELCPEYRLGIPLPGEMGISMYMRDEYTPQGSDKLRTSNLIQIDGRLSHSVSLGVRMHAPGEPDLVAAAFDVPGGFGAAELADPGRPTFRLRAEVIDDGDMPEDSEPEDNTGEHADDGPIIDFNLISRFSVGSVNASFDFQTPGNAPARRVDAVVYTNVGDINVGVDIAAFAGIEQSASPTEIDAYVSAQITQIFVDGKTQWDLPIGDWLSAVTDFVIETFIGSDSWVSKALSWLFDTIFGAIEEIINGVLNVFPAGFTIDGRADVNLDINDLSRFKYRQALLHGYAESEGSGDADIGPINLYFTNLSAGLYFDLPDIPLPTALINDILDALECVFTLGLSCDDDEFVPESIDLPQILLLGYGFHPTGINPLPFAPLFLDFRDCDALGGFASIVPALGAGFDNAVTVDGVEDFAIWPGTDPRLGFTGVAAAALNVAGVITVLAVDFIVDLVAGPILCHGFDNGEDTVLDIDYAADPATYNPGNQAASGNADIGGFAGHPVPGQPGAPLTLHESDDPSGEPATTPVPPVPAPPTPTEVAPPTTRPPLYAGTTGAVIDGPPIAMCGIHEFDTLVVDTAVTVATAPNPTLVDGDPACAAGSEGSLELRANELAVTDAASIDADAIADDIPDLAPAGPNAEEDLFRATGSSGGTNAGTGFDGSFPSSAVGPYTIDRTDIDDTVTAGGPGAAAGDGTSAGAAGLGGGAIVLRADTLLVVEGALSANGGDGFSNLAGECDGDPDDNDEPDLQSHHVDDDGDPDTPIENDDADPDTPDEPVPNDLADPPYEHVGFTGSGGGAGGGVLLAARTEIQLLDDGLLSATGGSGGDGLLGAGGGGGGGVIKVMAPIVSGVAQSDLDDATVAGLNGDIAPDGGEPCADVVPPATPTFDNPDTPEIETDPLPTDGFGKLVTPPFSQLEGYGPFWFQGGPQTPADERVAFTGYLTAGGGPGAVDVVACAVFLPDDESDGDSPGAIANAATALLPTATAGQLPSVDEPCGSRSGTTIVEMGRTTFTGSVQPPAEESQISLGSDDTGYHATYTTAVRAQTAGNDCFDPADEVAGEVVDDVADCLVEPLAGIDWVVGVDADAPEVVLGTIDATTTIGQIPVDFTAIDPQSGLFVDAANAVHGECRVIPTGTTPDTAFSRCVDGQSFPVPTPEGAKTLEVRVRDRAGNVSDTLTADFTYDTDFPQATATFVGGTVGGGGWYTSAPSLLFDGYSADAAPAADPYAYRFDNGLERTCGPVSDTDPADDPPFDVPCTVPASEVDDLVAGEHTLHYTAVSSAGRRHADDNDPNTGTPMPTATLRLDNQAPLVEVVPVGRPDEVFGGEPWYSFRPFVVVSAIDQFAASGVASTEISFGGVGGPWQPFDITAPPVLPIGVTNVCGRATDVAGTTSAPACTTVRADGEAPTFSFTASPAAPNGDNGWYVTAPSFTVGGYLDQPVPGGVGTTTDHFRTRYDNAGYLDCGAPSCTIPSSAFPSGRHLAHASATDRFDNRSGEQTFDVLVDLEDPVIQPVIGPVEPDGFNGWWHTAPYLTLFGDDGDGSGIAELEYSLTGPGGPYVTWTEPVLIGAGPHELCWRGTDVAGRASDVDCQAFEVDLDDPVAAITPSAAPNGDGWYGAPLVATASGDDAPAVPGSGVDPTFDPDLTDLCEDLSPAADPTSPSGRCIAVDGGPYVPLTGPVAVGEGTHTVRTFAVDVSGRRSAVAESVLQVDLSPPVVDLRLLPPDPARAGWYRATPRVVLRANDGADGSGVVALEYRVDGGAWTAYREPFLLTEGLHTVEHRASDLVGQRSGSVQVQADTTSPQVTATQADRLIWSRLLGPSTIKLNYTLSDDLSGAERVYVVIFDVTGNPVRMIQDPTFGAGQQFVTWDGRQGSLTGLVPLGVYYYRVVAMDTAGNWAQSGESKPITIRAV